VAALPAPRVSMVAWLATRAARPLWYTLAAVVLLATAVVAMHKQLRDGNDFPIYWQAARDLLSGHSPYDVGSGLHGYVYLPWFALLIGPLALLPMPAAAACWYAANLMFLRLAGGALLAALRAAAPAARARWLLLATLPLLSLFHDNLVLGQANLLLLLLLAVGVRGAMSERSGWSQGIPLGLAAALKMPAALLLLPLLLRGRARAVAGFAAVVLLAVLLPFLTTGLPLGRQMLREWRAKVLAPAAAGELQGSKVIDQSPHAALRRLLVDEPAFEGHAVNVTSLAPPAFAAASRIAAALLLLGYLLVWVLAPARAAPRALLLDLALGCCAMVQVVGFNLKAQFIVLLLPAWLAATLAGQQPARAPRVLLAVAGVLFLLSQPGLVGRTASNWLLACSSMTLGTLLLAAALVLQRFAVTPPPSVVRTAAPAPGTAP
jgi:glycosyl transferase family 87